jgi:hypothetical protein
MNNLVDIFCDVDDSCAVFTQQWKTQCLTDATRKRQRSNRMDMSEIMTVIILFHHPTIVISITFIQVILLVFLNLISHICLVTAAFWN